MKPTDFIDETPEDEVLQVKKSTKLSGSTNRIQTRVHEDTRSAALKVLDGSRSKAA